MNSEDQAKIESEIRSGFQDLTTRSAVAARARLSSDGRSARPQAGFRYAPALGLAVAAVIALLAGGAAFFALGNDDAQPLEAGPAGDDETVTEDRQPTADEPTTTADSSQADETIEDQGDGQADDSVRAKSRYRVATRLVAADVNDPFLNIRWSPDAEAELLARLPATYTGLEATGRSAEAADGGTWMQFRLLDPVPVNLGEPLHGGLPTGWANAAFVEALQSGLPVGTDELAPCDGGGSFLGEASNAAGGNGDGWYVYGMESGFVAEDCLRVVLTFGQGQPPLTSWENVPDDTGPATGIPPAQVVSSGGFGIELDLPGVDFAVGTATETDDSTFLVRQADNSLHLISLRPSRGDRLAAFADRGIIVIDVEVDGDPPPSGNGVHLTREPLVSDGRVDLVGIARPFEAQLDVQVVDEAGVAAEAVFSGNRFLGTRRADSYSARTNDWTEAWGSFAVRADGLASGSYVLELRSDGEDWFRVPFAIAGGAPPPAVPTDQEQSAALQLLGFAASGDVDPVPLADEVTLLLGAGGEQRVLSRTDLRSRQAWTFQADEAFGYVGPFNILDTLLPTGVQISSGPIDHCAGPPLRWPAALDGLRQVNIEPIGIDSCLSWFGVSLFLDGDGNISAVALDLWEP